MIGILKHCLFWFIAAFFIVCVFFYLLVRSLRLGI
jgi:hypothetical protein